MSIGVDGYFVRETGRPIIAVFPPCISNCAILKQGEQATGNYSAIDGYSAKSTSATIMWWKYQVETNGTRTPIGALQTVDVKLN
jgi:hypothetical protein